MSEIRARSARLEGYATYPFRSGDGIDVLLYRKRNEGGAPVLLLHGASAWSLTFATPPRTDGGAARSLADVLHAAGFEPWLLDWRGSRTVVERELDRVKHGGAPASGFERFDFDQAAAHDVPVALEKIREIDGWQGGIAAIGHCMGSGALAQAIAAGHVGRSRHGLTHVVLSTLGLFYEPALDGRMKSQDNLLERLRLGAEPVHCIDPQKLERWPSEVDEMYRNWPQPLRPHVHAAPDTVQDLCDRLSFMYGTPYLDRNLVPEIHREPHPASLKEQFGPIPLRMYAHAARNVRRRWAGRFDARDDDETLISDDARDRFHELASITLITGAKNQLWHRDSIDRMYEWLRRGPRTDRVRKEVFEHYGHQDLLWGPRAPEDVFGSILSGLPDPAQAARDTDWGRQTPELPPPESPRRQPDVEMS